MVFRLALVFVLKLEGGGVQVLASQCAGAARDSPLW